MSLSETISRISSGPVPSNEENAKMQCILPVLRALGWDDSDPSQVQFEFEVGDGKQRGRVDMAFIGPRRRSVAFIEAKAPGQDLERHVSQILNYAFHDGVDICALTTGLEWWLYLPREAGLPRDRRFAVLRLKDDQHEQLVDDFRTYLGREALVEKAAHKRAKQALTAIKGTEALRTEMPKVWQEMLEEPDHALVELIEQRVFSKIRLRPTGDQITSFLRGREISVSPGPPPLTEPSDNEETAAWKLVEKHMAGGDPKNQSAALYHYNKKFRVPRDLEKITLQQVREGWNPSRPQTPVPTPTAPVSTPPTVPRSRPSGYKLWGKRYPVKTYKELYVGVVTGLYGRHPRVFESQAFESKAIKIGRSRSSFRSGKPIGSSGLFIETHGSADALIRNSHTLLKHFGHSKNDLEVVFD